MIGIIWVMMVYSGHTYVPALEFTTQAKCEAAAVVIKEKYDGRGPFVGKMHTPWCVRIEKN